MSWRISKTFTFEAAHYLPGHDGKCSRLHGHSWKGTVELTGTQLYDEGPKKGMVMDYTDISAVIKPMVDQYLDHYCLNETLPMDNPTSEEVARWVYWHLKPSFTEQFSVCIEETCTSSCTYFQGTILESGTEKYIEELKNKCQSS